jgi:hypothetical protein
MPCDSGADASALEETSHPSNRRALASALRATISALIVGGTSGVAAAVVLHTRALPVLRDLLYIVIFYVCATR